MQTLKIFRSALQIRNASLILGKELKAIKLSEPEAMAFFDKPWTDVVKQYGSDKLLKENEDYTGYVAVCYGFRTDVIYMDGQLRHFSEKDSLFLPSIYAQACQDETLYDCTKASRSGVFNYVWTFGDCRFAEWAKTLQDTQRLEENPKQIAESLKSKLIAALQTSDPVVELTDSEDYVLQSYLGSYYHKFFGVIL